ncbi:putative mucin TcMUCII [Trypanosoma cruzi]|uniref:Mucin TcMUCII, putative n=2 Tax=Trypanosoma cruzi TaxID=5693 RepID=Q4DVB4_TRYCC|nr:mucin TcMUCII, putative [Trypanosoma cruzi]EAN96459.1 mucin TcMUCII, putative [Trypanosoma cruzi]PWV15841.1 putative mucin TcMUCII [Trypanosoma cruzi]|eukprot:XP_818310.1 mucin TcMUCII [Trypanosoma cruzi strain CL Brener]
MMMTCRLLCALLVLALCCCCPSVCVSETQLKDTGARVQEQGSGAPPPPPQPPTAKPVEAIVGAPSQSTPATGTPPVPGQSDLPTTGSVAKLGNGGGEGPGSTSKEGLGPKVSTEPNTSLTKGTKEQQSRTETSAEQTNKESEAPAQTTTTTTTTQPPTTTTTTTTEAPSTTITEAPAVSTTSAPSRLREIDGSLSSSAWVCAPLVLAASALAYTALG